jgi:hypothetical protein
MDPATSDALQHLDDVVTAHLIHTGAGVVPASAVVVPGNDLP